MIPVKPNTTPWLAALSISLACFLGAASQAAANDDPLSGCEASGTHTSARPFKGELREEDAVGFLYSPATDAYIQSIADPLRHAYGFPPGEPHIYVVPTDKPIVRARYENDIFISLGTLVSAGGSDAIAGYLAHEMGHIACHHSVINDVWSVADWALNAGLMAWGRGGAAWTRQFRGNTQVFVYLGGAGGIAGSEAAEWGYSNAGWSRDQETQADLIGTEMLVRAHLSTEGLVADISHIPESLANRPTSGEESAFSGSDHPSPDARRSAVLQYLADHHEDYVSPKPDNASYSMWRRNAAASLYGVAGLLSASRALGSPLALIGHPEFTNYAQRNQTALEFVRMAFRIPNWTPNESFPHQTDPELAALADLSLTKMIVAEIRLRMAPETVYAAGTREKVFSLPDMPERYEFLNTLGYMIDRNWGIAALAIRGSEKIVGITRENTLWGLAATSGGTYPSTNGGGQAIYSAECILVAEQGFLQACDDVQKHPMRFINDRWVEARILPEYVSTKGVLPALRGAPYAVHPDPGHSIFPTAPILSSDELKQEWIKN